MTSFEEFLTEKAASYVTVRAGWPWKANLPASKLLDLATLGSVKLEESSTDDFDLEIHVQCKADIVHSVIQSIKEMGGTVLEGEAD